MGFVSSKGIRFLFKYFNTAGVFLNRRINEDEIKKMKSVNFESINLEKNSVRYFLEPIWIQEQKLSNILTFQTIAKISIFNHSTKTFTHITYFIINIFFASF